VAVEAEEVEDIVPFRKKPLSSNFASRSRCGGVRREQFCCPRVRGGDCRHKLASPGHSDLSKGSSVEVGIDFAGLSMLTWLLAREMRLPPPCLQVDPHSCLRGSGGGSIVQVTSTRAFRQTSRAWRRCRGVERADRLCWTQRRMPPTWVIDAFWARGASLRGTSPRQRGGDFHGPTLSPP